MKAEENGDGDGKTENTSTSPKANEKEKTKNATPKEPERKESGVSLTSEEKRELQQEAIELLKGASIFGKSETQGVKKPLQQSKPESKTRRKSSVGGT